MKRSALSLVLGCGFLAVILLNGCASESGSETTPPATVEGTEDENMETGFVNTDTWSSAVYMIPSPNEVFDLIKGSDLPYKEGLIDVSNSNYSGVKAQSLNFGRITADIAYTSVFEKYQESISNFEELRKLSNDLGISYVFDEILVDRIMNNMKNADSLAMISTSSYHQIIEMMEGNEKGETLALIAAGGFLESLYIVTNLVPEYEADNNTIQRIADQKYSYENLVEYLKQYEEDPNVSDVLKSMEPIGTVFGEIEKEDIQPSAIKEGDKVVIGGGKLLITKEQFDSLKKAATDLRNSFSSAS